MTDAQLHFLRLFNIDNPIVQPLDCDSLDNGWDDPSNKVLDDCRNPEYFFQNGMRK